jgi:nicotinamide-nucleotide amidase
MQQHVLPRLETFAGGVSIVHKTIQTFGLPESFLAERLNDWEANMPRNINVAYLPNPTSIRIRLSSSGNSKELIELEIQKQVDALLKLIPNNIFGYENDTMASVVGDLLVNNSLMLAVAESCTGGTIAHLITHQSGSSRYFLGGVVAYSNDVKVSALGVDSHLIETYGAVSQQVVESMAQGVMLKLGSDYGIATSGIAVGTVWVAVSSKQGVVSERFSFGSDRERNILRSSVSALNMLRLLILSEKKIQ